MAHNIGHFEKIRALAAGGRLLALGGARAGVGSQITVYDRVANKRLYAIDVPAHVLSLAIAGEVLVAALSDGGVRTYNLADGKRGRELKGHAGAATAVAVGPGGEKAVSAGADGFLRLHSLATGKLLSEWQVSASGLRASAIDPSGEYAAGAGDDGVVHVVTVASGARRDMAGHDGPVNALAFTPRDGRLVSGGDDGTLRLYYLVGDTESEVRGKDDSGHVGAITAVVFGPLPTPLKDGTDPGERFFSAGVDGKVKSWRLGDRRRPRTLNASTQPVYGLAHVPVVSGEGLGWIAAGGDQRTVALYALDETALPAETATYLGAGFTPLAEGLAATAKPAREAAVKALSALDEPEALEMLVKTLKGDRHSEVRALVASELAAHGRRDARPQLREQLSDDNAEARAAVYQALITLDPDAPLSPLRAALSSKHADMRASALRDLVKHAASSPLVAGLVGSKFNDPDRTVRLVSLGSYESLFPEKSPEPLRAAYERGPSDLKVEVLVRAALAGLSASAGMAPVIAHAFDDEDADVRRTAFTLKVIERPALRAVLEAKDAEFARAVTELARHVARSGKAQLGGAMKEPSDEELKAARARLLAALEAGRAPGAGKSGGELGEADLTPLLMAMSCQTPETALRGARGLAELGDTRALGALLQLSREGDKNIRREAARALQALSDPRAKKRLVWMLDDAAAEVRASAFDAYQKLEPSPLSLAEAALRSSQEDIRVRGLNLLVKQADSRTGETDALLGDALEDQSPQVRAEAFRTLWSWHDKEPERALSRALSARFGDLRLRAVTELEAHGKEPWARASLLATIADRDALVAQAAYDALVKLTGKKAAEPHLSAMASMHAPVRTNGAFGARHAKVDEVRSALTKLVEDADTNARTTALDSLDKLLPGEAGPLYVGLSGSHLDAKVKAAELLSLRHDEQIIDAMQKLLGDKELARTVPAAALHPLRFVAAKSLAALGSRRLLRYFATELLKDEQPEVREQAARGLANASRKGDEGFLLDALGHADVAVRSWAADGLSRLGDARALPVLTGHLRHDHQPVRLGAILSFAALGPEGYGGMLQGLEDPSKEVEEIVFMLVLARDLRAFRLGEPPDLLTSALSSQRGEVRFAAARALELRGDPEPYLGHLLEVLSPPRPEKVSDMKDWPAEERRGRLLTGLLGALASDRPELRYAAAQSLLLRKKPLEFFRELESLVRPRSATGAVIPDTTPRASEDSDAKPKAGWLRRLFAEAPGASRGGEPSADEERKRLWWLSFGAYVGLLRQVGAGDEEGPRVRRDAIERIVEQAARGQVSVTSAVPALSRALDDPHYLVRRAAFAGLSKLFPAGSDEPLSMALSSSSDDVARAALDQLASLGEAGRPQVAQALSARLPEVRKHAFELLEKMSPKGSLEPLIAALESDHADMRIGVIERLSSSQDPRVVSALVRAMRSEHEDLRLRAAELLAQRRDDRAVEVLSAFLRSQEAASVARARAALSVLGSKAAVGALAARLDDADAPLRAQIMGDLGRTRSAEAIDVLSARFADEDAGVRAAAFEAALHVAGDDRKKRDHALSLRFLRPAARSKDASIRLRAATELDIGEEAGQGELLVALFADRDAPTRVQAVKSYAERVKKLSARVEPLDDVVRAGARELLLWASEGVAERGGASAFRPLLLVSRAGEGGERERALLALGALGDARALEELETVAGGGTKEAPTEPSMQAAALEALGRMLNKLKDAEAKARVVERIENALAHENQAFVEAALKALRWTGGERARGRLEGFVIDENTDWRLKVAAIDQLAELADTASEAALARALSDDDSDVREHARKALDRLFPTERTRVEFLALASPHGDISEPAAVYLSEQGDSALLLPRLGGLGDAELREGLRYGLLRRAVLPAPALVALLEQTAPSARENGAWLLGNRAAVGAGGAGAAGVGAAGGGGAAAELSPADREAIVKALIAAEARTEGLWTKATGDEKAAEEAAWERLLWALGWLGGKGVVPRARAHLRGGEQAAPASVRRASAHAIERLGGEREDIDTLASALRDGDQTVRAAAAAALSRLVPERAASMVAEVVPFDAVAFASAGGRSSPALLASSTGRRVSLPSLLAARDASGLGEVIKTTKDEPTLLDAISAAGRAGDPGALEVLRALASDKKGRDAATRKAAYRALRRAQRRIRRDEKTKEQVPA